VYQARFSAGLGYQAGKIGMYGNFCGTVTGGQARTWMMYHWQAVAQLAPRCLRMNPQVARLR
jgi:hypothetical protein